MEMSLLKMLGCVARVNNIVIVSSIVYCIAKKTLLSSLVYLRPGKVEFFMAFKK